MPTQVVELDAGSAPSTLRVRDDVTGVLVVITDDGRPIELVRVRRPADGLLRSAELLKARPRPRAVVDRSSTDEQRAAPVPAAPRVSVVIPTRERPDDLARCLESLARPENSRHEVIVVDNAPVTTRTAAVAARFGVRHVVEPKPGIDNARNAGVAVARHDIVAFIDDDAVASPKWMTAIGEPFADSRVGCVTGLVLPLELETKAQEDFELYCHHRRDFQRRVYSRESLRPSAAGIVGMGANMAFRRRLLVELGWFDPRLGTGTSTRGGDETDMFARIFDAGWLIVYSPSAFVWHRHRRTSRELRACVFGYGVGLYSMLTKRLLEQRDLGALITGARWLLGPPLKAARAKIKGAPSAPWRVVLAETVGAPLGPFCFGYETWRNRARLSTAPASEGARQ